jgi:hypothetical protein
VGERSSNIALDLARVALQFNGAEQQRGFGPDLSGPGSVAIDDLVLERAIEPRTEMLHYYGK